MRPSSMPVARVHEALGVELEERAEEAGRAPPFGTSPMWTRKTTSGGSTRRATGGNCSPELMRKVAARPFDGVKSAVQPAEVRLDVLHGPHRFSSLGGESIRASGARTNAAGSLAIVTSRVTSESDKIRLGMPLESGSLVGCVVGGHYKVRRLIGQGGMGEVYAADGKSGEKVALKVLHEKAAQDPDLVARFQREAEIAAQIKSPHVACILGAGKDRNGRLWIAFERSSARGSTSASAASSTSRSRTSRPSSTTPCRASTPPTRRGVIHRDIKPANLFIEKRRLDRRATSQRRRAGGADAHPRLRRLQDAAPGRDSEQRAVAHGVRRDARELRVHGARAGARHRARVDARADLYALGAVAFRALTGRLPFEGPNALTLIALKLDREPPSLASTTGDAWPQAIERFLAKMMAREREKRFACAHRGARGLAQGLPVMGNAPRRRPRLLPVRDERTDVTSRTFTGVSSVSKAGS